MFINKFGLRLLFFLYAQLLFFFTAGHKVPDIIKKPKGSSQMVSINME